MHVRNINLVKDALIAGGLAGLCTYAALVSNFVPLAAVAVALWAIAIVQALSWYSADLRTGTGGVVVGGLIRRRNYGWTDIDRFTILSPDHRGFLVQLWPPIDRARLHLNDGTTVVIRALQPYHGYTIWNYFQLGGRVDADEIVDQLNKCAARNGN
jgi:hypothetical protein